MPIVAALILVLLTGNVGAGAVRDGDGGNPRPDQVAAQPVDVIGFVRAIDGDTFEVRLNGRRAGIGILGVDAPQGNTRCGREAAALLWQLVDGGVRLEDDPDPGLRFDERNRRMYHARTLSGLLIAEALITAGVARADGRGERRAEMSTFEGQARSDRRGCLWTPATPSGGKSPSLTVDPATAFVQEMPRIPSAITLPEGFVPEVIASGLASPTAFAPLPDGRFLVAEKSGVVRIVKGGAVLPTSFIDIRDRVNDYWDHGLIGMAADPDFVTNGFVYLLYTYEDNRLRYDGTKTARLARYTASGDTASPASEVVILGTVVGASCQDVATGSDCLPSDAPSHSIGAIDFAPDGTMFVTVGDAASFNLVDDLALRAQDLDSLAGKVLHVTRSGAGVSTNPFWTGVASANRSKVWAYGVRNAFRMDVHAASGVPYVGDVGWDYREEINAAVAGANLGWPCFEGNARQSGYEPKSTCQALYAKGTSAVRFALLEYDHCQLFCGSTSVTGGAFYTGTAFPEQYRGAYFYGDYAQGFIRYLKADASHALVPGSSGTLANDADGPVDFKMGADGNLYYLAINLGELRRLSYATAPPPGATTRYLSDLTWTAMTNGWGPVEKDQSNGEQGTGDGRTITLADQTFAKGLGAHAASEVRYALSSCTTFTAQVGVDDEVGVNGSVTFEVWGDATKLYDSGVLTGTSATKSLSVDLSGRTELRLVVTDGGDNVNYDHADWADAKIVCGGTSGGTGGFGPPTAYASGTNTHGVTSADLNGDGRLDLIGTNAGSNNVRVLLGSGDGTLIAGGTFGVGTTPKMSAAADLNGDGKIDLVTADQDSHTLSVLIGDGAGRFAAARTLVGCSRPHEVAIADFNADGRRDLAVACWGSTQVGVLLGNGDGTFAGIVNYTAGPNPHSVAIADFDRDGILDLAVANNGEASISVLRGLGNGTFGPAQKHTVGSRPHSVRSADLNADGLLDLATANEGSDNASVLLGNGDGTFRAAVSYATGRVPKSVAIGDVNGDGKPDLVVANTAGNYPVCCNPGGDTVSVLPGNGDGTFGSAATHTVGTTPFSVTLADLDRDGDLDLATANWDSNDVTVLVNLTKVPVADTTAPTVSSVAPANGATAVAVGSTVSATFSEAMDAATISSATFTLATAGSAVSAAVSYDAASRTATLDPAASLAAGVTYTATVKGGTAGAKDLAGNALAADRVWTFTTASSGNTPPVPTIAQPASTFRYKVGDAITYSGGATDAEDGTIPASGLAWRIVLHHCPGGICHAHPFSTGTGAGGTFTIPDHGDESYFEIILTATDSAGAVGTTSVSIRPLTVLLTLKTSPGGLSLVYGGRTVTAPFTVTTVVGSTHTIHAPSPQERRVFESWSDGGAQQHNITVGTTDVTYTAVFRRIR